MHPTLADRLAARGFVTRPEFFALGLDDKSIAIGLRSGELHGIGPGLYAGRAYSTATAEQQHLIRCHAVSTRFPERIAFTHQSAALLHGLPVWGCDLDKVHVTRLDGGRGRRQAHVSHHVGLLGSEQVTQADGLPVSTLPRTLWDLASTQAAESSLVTLDAALHDRLVSEADLVAMAGAHTSWRGSRQAKIALTLADPAAESPGESRCRWAFHEASLPQPVSQFKIFDRAGRLAGIADFAWPAHRHLVEFDGLIKYGSAADLAKEKAREDLLRSLGWGITRIIWSQLNPQLRPALMRDLAEAMALSRRLYAVAS